MTREVCPTPGCNLYLDIHKPGVACLVPHLAHKHDDTVKRYKLVADNDECDCVAHDCDQGYTCCDGCAHTGHGYVNLSEGHPDIHADDFHPYIAMPRERIAMLAFVVECLIDMGDERIIDALNATGAAVDEDLIASCVPVLREMIAEAQPLK